MSRYRPEPWLLILAHVLAKDGFAEQYPPAIQSLIQAGVEVEKSFPVPEGITGYVIKAQGQYNIVYLTADRKHVLIGSVLDERGQSLTALHEKEHLPAPDYTEYWNRLEKAAWVAEGAKNPKNYVYVFADPYCPYCHALWRASLPYQAAGLQLRWALVAYLRDDSAAKAAAIMEANDPGAAMKAHEQDYSSGGIAPLAAPKAETVAAIQANNRLLQDLGANGTPAVLYRDVTGRVRLLVGMPKLASLPDIFKLPEQAQTDPSLEHFRK